MLENLTIFQTARALAEHASAGQVTTARNVANADTPGYRAQTLRSFADTYNQTDSFLMRGARAGHMHGSDAVYNPQIVTDAAPDTPNGNSVALDREMMRAAQYRQQHDLALTVYKSALNTLRASIRAR